jgi:putative PIN family toxin of toxin-antitoxin system
MFWVSYSTRKSSFRRRLIERALRQRVRFFVSEYILSELEVTLVVNLEFTVRFAHLARKAALRAAKLVRIPPTIRRLVPGDPKDDPIVQTALSAKADYLVTADKEILRLGKVRDVEIITASQFEHLLTP